MANDKRDAETDLLIDIQKIIGAENPYDAVTLARYVEHRETELRRQIADSSKSEIRELLCQRCSNEYCVWYADNKLWNKFTVSGEHFLCPTCFMILAEERGFKPSTAWRLSTESYLEEAERETPEEHRGKLPSDW